MALWTKLRCFKNAVLVHYFVTKIVSRIFLVILATNWRHRPCFLENKQCERFFWLGAYSYSAHVGAHVPHPPVHSLEGAEMIGLKYSRQLSSLSSSGLINVENCILQLSLDFLSIHHGLQGRHQTKECRG